MANITKDWVEAYFDYGIDQANRRVFLLGDVEQEAIGHVVKAIYYLDAKSTREPIELFIGSHGGCEYEMFGLYDVLNSTTCPIHTVAIGKCFSAAPLLVAAGEPGERYAMPNCQFMVHHGYSSDSRDLRIDDQKKTLAHYGRMHRRWCELMARHTALSEDKWKRMCASVGDTFFDAETAMAHGLVDHLWSEKG